MSAIKITETGEIKELECTIIKYDKQGFIESQQDMVNDWMAEAALAERTDEGYWLLTEDDYEWWVEYAENYAADQAEIAEIAKKFGMSIEDVVGDAYWGHDWDDHHDAIQRRLVSMEDMLTVVMTPAEIEQRFELGSGTVRQAVNRAPDGDGVWYRRPDQRTILVSTEYAFGRWGTMETELRESANTRTKQIAVLDDLLRGILYAIPDGGTEDMNAEEITDVTLEWWYGQKPELPKWFGDADREYIRNQLVEEIENS